MAVTESSKRSCLTSKFSEIKSRNFLTRDLSLACKAGEAFHAEIPWHTDKPRLGMIRTILRCLKIACRRERDTPAAMDSTIAPGLNFRASSAPRSEMSWGLTAMITKSALPTDWKSGSAWNLYFRFRLSRLARFLSLAKMTKFLALSCLRMALPITPVPMISIVIYLIPPYDPDESILSPERI